MIRSNVTAGRTLGAAVLAALVLAGVATSPAQASPGFYDSFENTSSSSAEQRWIAGVGGSGTAAIVTHAAGASEGSRYGRLQAIGAGSFASLAHRLTVTSSTSRCSADVQIDPEGHQPDGHVHANLEVIDPATWTYVSLRQLDIDVRHSGYERFKFTPWTGGPRQVLVRVSVLGYTTPGGVEFGIEALIDELTVSCT